MKKIIDGVLYNTETATELYKHWNGLPYTDFSVIDETLYRKRNGEYFIYGSGGPLTKYAEKHGNCYGYGETITPLTEQKARLWIEKHADAETYIYIFGCPGEGSDVKKYSYYDLQKVVNELEQQENKRAENYIANNPQCKTERRKEQSIYNSALNNLLYVIGV